MTTHADLKALVASLPPVPPDPFNGATQIYASASLVEELEEVVSVLGRLRYGRRVAVFLKESLPAGCALGMKGCQVALLITPERSEVMTPPHIPTTISDSAVQHKPATLLANAA